MGSKADGLSVCSIRSYHDCYFVAVSVVLPRVGNLLSRELTLLGQAFAALVDVELRDQR
jgi:hypothetical protein